MLHWMVTGKAVPTFSALLPSNTSVPRSPMTAELGPWVRLQVSSHSSASVLWDGLVPCGLAVLLLAGLLRVWEGVRRPKEPVEGNSVRLAGAGGNNLCGTGGRAWVGLGFPSSRCQPDPASSGHDGHSTHSGHRPCPHCLHLGWRK